MVDGIPLTYGEDYGECDYCEHIYFMDNMTHCPECGNCELHGQDCGDMEFHV